MAQYQAEVFSDAVMSAAVQQFVDDVLLKVAPANTYPCEPIKGVFVSYIEELPAGDGNGAGGGSYVWGG